MSTVTKTMRPALLGLTTCRDLLREPLMMQVRSLLDALAAVPYTGAFIYELAPPSGLSQAGLDFIFNYRYLADRFAKSHGE